MMMPLPATLRTLILSAELKAELYPILLFFGMFFVIFGMGGMLVRHLPRKPGSMLDEILSEKWEDEDEPDKPEDEIPPPESEMPSDNVERPEPEDTMGK